MAILARLSSQSGDRTEANNHAVAAECLAEPVLLATIVNGLASDEAALVGDCAEVLTFVSELRPDLVAPDVDVLISLLGHRTTRVRWEVVHALSHVAVTEPALVAPALSELTRLLDTDQSVIVRDHAVDALVAIARGDSASRAGIVQTLLDALDRWDGKQAARILSGLASIAAVAPEHHAALGGIGSIWTDHPRPGVHKAARALVRTTGG